MESRGRIYALVHPKHEENPIRIITSDEPGRLNNNYAGCLIIIALLFPALLFSIRSGHVHYTNEVDLRKALAEERAKPVVNVLKVKPFVLRDQINGDVYPPIFIPPFLRNNYRLPYHMY